MQDLNFSYMQRCFDLALRGIDSVSPNPMVGAVLVYDNIIIGEGYHEYFGGPHAEVNCVNSVLPAHKHLIAHAHLYVSLEPCNHSGKTPPCTELIIKHNIKEVTIGCVDAFKSNKGSGVQNLINNGIKVNLSPYSDEARLLNKRFFTFQEKRRPYLILKWAQTKNGFFAPKDGSRLQLSGIPAQTLVHKWRSEEDAILVGANTAINDNPRLNNRHWLGKSPLRIIWDGQLKTPETHHIFTDRLATIIINHVHQKNDGGIQWIQCEEKDFLSFTLNWLYRNNKLSVLIEGGAKVLDQFLAASLWDECRVIQSNKVIENGIPAPLVTEGFCTDHIQLPEDNITIWRHHHSL